MKQYSKGISPLFLEFIKFNRYRNIVEIGVAAGGMTRYLCEAVMAMGGFVYGFDIWTIHGLRRQFKQISSKECVDEYLKSCGLKNFELIQVDTRMEEFGEIIRKKCPTIDFAFIDGCHSYEGIKNDFDIVYPLLNETGMIAFHDTLKIDGCREFMIDLRTIYYDGTFDIIDMPWGNGKRRVGVSILMKRTYPVMGWKIDEICGSLSEPHEIYKKEKEWYEKELSKKEFINR